ncbi:MAG: hypothetical protein K9L64_06915 [Candidatus Izimaplasma sp.]|nr:hypothetical protein [Candidatus Izimaplasma bacterium]
MNTKELKTLLKPLSKNELKDMLVELNKKQVNKLFFDEYFLSLTYNDMLEIVNQHIDQHSQYGFVYARDAHYIFEAFDKFIDLILDLKQPVKQINLLIQLLSIGGNLQDVDDSYGGLQETQNEILYHIDMILSEDIEVISEEDRMIILQNAFQYHKDENLLGIDDWRNQLFIDLIVLLNTDKLYNYFDHELKMIENAIGQGKDDYCAFRKAAILQVRFSLINYKDQEQALQFVLDHLHYPLFKNIHLELLANRKSYQALFETVNQYLNEQKGNHRSFLKYRLFAAEKLNNVEAVRDTARLLLEYREYDYYQVYKNTFKEEDLDKMINNIVLGDDKELRQFVIIEEDLQDLMVKDINQEPRQLSYYYKHLSPKSMISIQEAYQSLIYQEAKHANKRSHYRRVCKIIKSYQEDYQTNGKEIIEKLENDYHRKTAFLDELSKI